MQHPLWWILTLAAVGWYSTVTIYISVRGMKDIRGMLQRLKDKQTP